MDPTTHSSLRPSLPLTESVKVHRPTSLPIGKHGQRRCYRSVNRDTDVFTDPLRSPKCLNRYLDV
ncbi:hypothetical protein HanIR_Chr12g0608861 [Helianthus annuus]|nr:hypothetical protein HanIR_Chr12g0608861 [Helianthus annuus]